MGLKKIMAFSQPKKRLQIFSEYLKYATILLCQFSVLSTLLLEVSKRLNKLLFLVKVKSFESFLFLYQHVIFKQIDLKP